MKNTNLKAAFRNSKGHEDHGERLIPVRVSPDEIRYLNMLQGEQLVDKRVDPKIALRVYSPLAHIIKIPVIKHLFIVSMKMAWNEKVPEHLEELVNKLDVESGETVETIPSDSNPAIQKLEAEGDGDDKRVVLLPESVAAFFEALQGGPHLDSVRGFDEFFKKKHRDSQAIPYKGGVPIISDIWNSVTDVGESLGIKKNHMNEGLRIVGTIGGGIMGGPVGAGAGNAAASMITGKSFKDSAFSGLKNAALVGGINRMAPGLASSFGLPALTGASSTLAPVTQMGAKGVASSVAAKAAAGQAASAAASSGAGGIFSGLMGGAGKYAPLAAGLLLSMKGRKDEHRKEEARAGDSQKALNAEMERTGFRQPLKNTLNIPDSEEHLRLHPRPPLDIQPYRSIRSIPTFKDGGAIEGKPIIGPGTGQSDSINVDSTKEGEWIWDASTTSDLGDGTTDAGWRQIRRLEKHVRSLPGFKDMYEFLPHKKPEKVKTALSNGEYRTPTKIVTMIGRGSNERGANILRRMTKDIRLYKISQVDKLPPPIGDPMKFFHHASAEEFGHA